MIAPCSGKSRLFDSTLISDHMEAAKLCAACPMVPTCQARLEESLAAWSGRSGKPEGTWAGQLVIAGKVATDRVMRVAQEERLFSAEDARRAHAAFWRGERGDWVEAGERTYQRRAERRQRAERARRKEVA